METKNDELELRRVGQHYAYFGGPTNDGSIDYGRMRVITHEFHPQWCRIKLLYNLLKEKNGPHHWVNRIMLDIQQYGIEHKLKKADLIAMNRLYKEYNKK